MPTITLKTPHCRRSTDNKLLIDIIAAGTELQVSGSYRLSPGSKARFIAMQVVGQRDVREIILDSGNASKAPDAPGRYDVKALYAKSVAAEKELIVEAR